MSRCLCDRSIDHIVLERGDIAHTWRTQRWDSLRLLTPNSQSRLPGFSYNGDDPDGYRTVAEVIEFIASYAKAVSAKSLMQTATAYSMPLITSRRRPKHLPKTRACIPRSDQGRSIVAKLSLRRGVNRESAHILKGTKPQDIPFYQPKLVVDLKTAKSLGIDVPHTLLARADKVIE
jgi:hypothetical protein